MMLICFKYGMQSYNFFLFQKKFLSKKLLISNF